jgi:crotonobetainyl-CoA:carnitine CoA-transferase CaiB-like acyl-CoA transferase
MWQPNALSGVKVLDFTQFIAGPVVTRMMAELGAEVIKVELAPGGDNARKLPNFKDGRSAYFIQHNLGKKSLCLDIAKPEARELLLKLVEKTDVVVENFSPGIIDRFGLGWDVVKERNPWAIMCSISAFGQKGELSRLRGFDFIAQSYSGVTSVIGEPDKAPSVPGVAMGDVGTGMLAYGAIATALYTRAKPGGTGQFLDIALVDFYMQCHEINVQLVSTSGGSIVPSRTGSQHNVVCPFGLFRCTDGYVMITCLGEHWRLLCAVIGRTEMANDPRYIDNAARMAHQADVVGAIEAWTSTRTMSQALDALDKGKVPAAPMLTVDKAMQEPHLLERQTVRTIQDPVFGSFQVPGMPLRFSAFPLREPGMAPFLGQHNEEVLGDVGVSAQQVRALTEKGVLVEKRI